MRILILGAYGMLGHTLIEQLAPRHELFATCRVRRGNRIDALLGVRLRDGFEAETVDLDGLFDEIRPEAVVNCIGLIKQLPNAQDPVATLRINALFPHLAARACRARGIRLVHFSTDCVFAGTTGGYGDDAVCDATDLYGRTKALGEVGGAGAVTLRSSIIGPELGSAHGLLGWFMSNRGGSVRGYRRAIYSGFTTFEMARIVERVLKQAPELSGVWNVASTPISKLELLERINARLRLGIRIAPDETFVCDRSLDGSRFARAVEYEAPSWSQMIDELALEEKG